jgi:ATP/ADP translocase
MTPMHADSPLHWFVGLVGFLLFVIPAVKIVRKAGYSGWWVVASLIPFVNVIMFWVFAFARWPLEDRAGTP